ncbi:uncharacterized protein LOC131883404 [Tigriopus californicus]|uniref:uncharacterized protein LOC131883404 n=1 Tax=Tigriopus californicus TaxID=6832 RepID=UPI0027DA77FB|nr:uncharacterized protein LOC131883404 [Tigriopus californicus]
MITKRTFMIRVESKTNGQTLISFGVGDCDKVTSACIYLDISKLFSRCLVAREEIPPPQLLRLSILLYLLIIEMISLDKLGLILISLTLMNLNGILANAPKNPREKRLFSVFNVVQFQNEACQTLNNNQLGVCYTGEECLKRQGTVSGHCASGFGVCCLFQVGCNMEVSENCTYFSSSIGRVGSGFCNAKVCPCSSDICQIRLDFLDFSIAGPSMSAQVAGFSLNGNQIENTQGPAITTTSRCITDFFQITNPGGSNPPIVCGQNSGEHVYVDSSSSCNDLSFFIRQFNPVPSSGQDSSWLIKISQFACTFGNLAPSGCTQWFYGTNQGIVKTFNYEAGAHLANQDQSICIRQDKWSFTFRFYLRLNASLVVYPSDAFLRIGSPISGPQPFLD